MNSVASRTRPAPDDRCVSSVAKCCYSVVIRTFNSERTLGKTLHSIRFQKSSPSEILVVDSGSSDSTLELAKKFDVRILSYPTEKPFNYATALNLGLAAAVEPYVLIISSHTVIPHADTVTRMLDELTMPGIAGVYCVTSWFLNRRESLRRGQKIRAVEIDARTFDGYNGLWNTCAVIRKCDWIMRKFDETMWTAEDQEWAAWHHRNTQKRTVRLEGTGAIDLNHRRSKWKAVCEHVAIAYRCYPEYYKWTTIGKRWVRGFLALLLLKRALFKEEILYASVLALHRLGLLKFQSQYYSGPPLFMRWLVH